MQEVKGKKNLLKKTLTVLFLISANMNFKVISIEAAHLGGFGAVNNFFQMVTNMPL